MQRSQLFVAADDGRVLAPRIAVQAARRHQPVGGHLFGLSLELQWLDCLDLDRVAHQLVGGFAQVDFVHWRRLFQPRGHVHRVAGGQLLVGLFVVVGHHLAGVDAGAVGQRHAIALHQVVIDTHQRLAHVGRGAHGAQRVVFVRLGQAEDGHDGVADVLLDLAAVARDLGGHGCEVAVLDLVQCLGVEPLAQRGGVLQVAEDQCHRLAHFAHRQRRRCRDERRAAVSAKTELRWIFLAATRAVDHAGKSTGRV